MDAIPRAPRRISARLVLVLLNLFGPGLANLRLGQGWAALILMFAGPVALFALALVARILPEVTPHGLLVTLVVMGSLWLLLSICAIVTVWQGSVERRSPRYWWSRWWAMLLAYTAMQVALILSVAAVHRVYKPFFTPSQSMVPTIRLGDRFLARMGNDVTVRRGDIILVATAHDLYVKRVIGMPGDRVSLVGGQVFVNGEGARQIRIGRQIGNEYTTGIVVLERLPGEAQAHRTLDSAIGEADDYPETRVPPGRLFLLGDNRDHSADSRFATTHDGLGMVPLASVRGRALFRTFDADLRWIGDALD